jgi:hypothetical protein
LATFQAIQNMTVWQVPEMIESIVPEVIAWYSTNGSLSNTCTMVFYVQTNEGYSLYGVLAYCGCVLVIVIIIYLLVGRKKDVAIYSREVCDTIVATTIENRVYCAKSVVRHNYKITLHNDTEAGHVYMHIGNNQITSKQANMQVEKLTEENSLLCKGLPVNQQMGYTNSTKSTEDIIED